jgi:hypothetical protein
VPVGDQADHRVGAAVALPGPSRPPGGPGRERRCRPRPARPTSRASPASSGRTSRGDRSRSDCPPRATMRAGRGTSSWPLQSSGPPTSKRSGCPCTWRGRAPRRSAPP